MYFMVWVLQWSLFKVKTKDWHFGEWMRVFWLCMHVFGTGTLRVLTCGASAVYSVRCCLVSRCSRDHQRSTRSNVLWCRLTCQHRKVIISYHLVRSAITIQSWHFISHFPRVAIGCFEVLIFLIYTYSGWFTCMHREAVHQNFRVVANC